jgi:NAD(P)-dependent dehydrogenase (short-subunit alcohol dehydrogenase family)
VTELRFDGRVAVITGAGRGVGREYALLLAARGATVVVNDLGVAPDGSGPSGAPAEAVVEQIRSLGGTAVADISSVAEQTSAEALIARTVADFGRIDILIHNAGIVEGSFEALGAINLGAAYWLTEACWMTMHDQHYGRILLTTSSAGLFGSANGPDYQPMQSYGATKMGALGLGKCLAVRGRTSNITVNMVSPNAYTRLAAGLPPSPNMTWMQEHSKPELVAPGAAFLVHESCPVSGETFGIGAGRMARIFIGQTVGYVNQELTPEDVAEHFQQICNEDGYQIPTDMKDLTDIYRRTVDGS